MEQSDSLIMSVGEAAEVLGISRTLAYRLVSSEELPSLRFGGRLWIPRRGLERLTAAPGGQLLAAGGGHAEGGGPGDVAGPPCPVPSAPRAPDRRPHDPESATQLALFDPTPTRP